jgi:hypothetical protein
MLGAVQRGLRLHVTFQKLDDSPVVNEAMARSSALCQAVTCSALIENPMASLRSQLGSLMSSDSVSLRTSTSDGRMRRFRWLCQDFAGFWAYS